MTILLIYMIVKKAKPNITKHLHTQVSLIAISETPVFSSPSCGLCFLSAMEEGLQIDVATRPQASYLLSYDRIFKFQLYKDKSNNKNPDHILIEFKTSDSSVQQIHFRQTKIYEQLNQKSLRKSDIFNLVNVRILSQNNNK